MNCPITLHKRPLPLPPLRPRLDMFLVLATSIYVVPIMFYSNPTTVLCTGNITLFAHKGHNHGFPDFPVQQYSYFLFSTRYFIFYFLVVVKSSTLFIYTRYIIPYVLEHCHFIHTWYIYIVVVASTRNISKLRRK